MRTLESERAEASPRRKPRQESKKHESGRISEKPAKSSPPAGRTVSSVRLVLAYPPSLNTIWRAVVVWSARQGGHVAKVLLSRAGRKYRKRVAEQVRQQGQPRLPDGARLVLTLEVSPPDRRARDLSNIPKALEDALTHAGVWADDSLIDELHIYRCLPKQPPQVVATVSVLVGEP